MSEIDDLRLQLRAVTDALAKAEAQVAALDERVGALIEETMRAQFEGRRAGAEAMREAAVAACLLVDDEYDALACAEAIRALPLPEVPR